MSCGFIPSPTESDPCGSKSTSSTLRPYSASEAPRLIVVVVLPTPPFWLHIEMIRALPWMPIGRGSGRSARAAGRAEHHPSSAPTVATAAPRGAGTGSVGAARPPAGRRSVTTGGLGRGGRCLRRSRHALPPRCRAASSPALVGRGAELWRTVTPVCRSRGALSGPSRERCRRRRVTQLWGNRAAQVRRQRTARRPNLCIDIPRVSPGHAGARSRRPRGGCPR